jgi:hypothetical protein
VTAALATSAWNREHALRCCRIFSVKNDAQLVAPCSSAEAQVKHAIRALAELLEAACVDNRLPH